MAERLDEDELKAILAQEIVNSVTYCDTELSADRVTALEYYDGVMKDTPAQAGRSQLMSRDVADTIGWMLPGIIRVFTASDMMAEFEPVGAEDEQFAKDASAYCNHVFWKDNNGYRILWDSTHDALLQKNGIIKHWWDEAEECEYSVHTGMTEEQIALLMEEGEIVAQRPGEPQQIETPQGIMSVPTFDVKLKRVTKSGKLRVECIAPEDFLLDEDAITIEDARFCAHRDEKTRSELIEMGFSKELVESLPAYSRISDSDEEQARNPDYLNGYNGHDSTAPVELFECYLKVDVDGDGIAETVRAYYAGKGGAGELLDWETWDDDVPFSDIPCEPVPHRWAARSVADETMDIQRVKTVFTRGLADNLYWVNNPMQSAELDNIINPEMMTSPVFGGVIWRRKGALPPDTIDVPFVGDKLLMGLEHFDTVTEKRTGVSRATMALDPETLQNQSATANQNQKDASYSQVELIARNMAELGWKRVFKMILRLVTKHQDRPRVIRLKNKPVEMDPRFWNSDMDVTINVGLGTGTRDRDMAMLNNILVTQNAMAQQLVATGFSSEALDMLPKIIKTATKLAESSGIRNPDEYYIDIDEQKLAQMKEQAAQPKTDPKIELEKQKLGMEVEKTKVEMQMDAQKNEQDIVLQREKMAGEMQIKREQMAAEMQLKREQLAAELMLKKQLAEQEMQIKREQGFYHADMNAEVGKYKADATSKVHMGGNPG